MHKGWKLHSYDSLQLFPQAPHFYRRTFGNMPGLFFQTPQQSHLLYRILPLNSSQKVVHRQPARPEDLSFFQRRLPKPLCRVELQYNLSPDAQRRYLSHKRFRPL